MQAKKILIIVAAHHLSGNIASQRFRSLVKSIDHSRYEIHLVTRSVASGDRFPHDPKNGSIHVVEGDCIGSGLGWISTLLVLLLAFLRRLPLGVFPRDVWLANVLRYVLRSEIGERIRKDGATILATYSPIDALVAARCLQEIYGGRCILDFRDGFVFESLGRRGKLASFMRSRVERRVISGADIVLSVSKPLVNDFRERYRGQRVELLPNGFDPGEVASVDAMDHSEVGEAILGSIPGGKHVIAHFGRIGTSDATRAESLRFFIQSLSMSSVADQIHVLFVGDLANAEKDVIRSLKCESTQVGNVDRDVAQYLMRRVDSLLLITGSGRGCVTGKLFEYLAAMRPVVCFSGVINEASRIISETSSGRTVVVGDENAARDAIQDLVHGNIRGVEDIARIMKYSRAEQARSLCDWIESI